MPNLTLRVPDKMIVCVCERERERRQLPNSRKGYSITTLVDVLYLYDRQTDEDRRSSIRRIVYIIINDVVC